MIGQRWGRRVVVDDNVRQPITVDYMHELETEPAFPDDLVHVTAGVIQWIQRERSKRKERGDEYGIRAKLRHRGPKRWRVEPENPGRDLDAEVKGSIHGFELSEVASYKELLQQTERFN